MVESLQLEHEEFTEAIGPVDGRTTLTGLECEPWRVDSWSTDVVEFQVMQEGGPNVYEGANSEGLITIGIGLPAPANMVVNGVRLGWDSVVVLRPGLVTTTFSKGVSRYVLTSLPYDRFVTKVERLDPSLTENIHTCPTVNRLSRQNSQKMRAAFSKLLQTVANGSSADERPFQRHLADEYIHAIVEGLRNPSSEAKSAGRPKLSRRHIMTRVEDILNEPSYFQYSTSEMAQYAGVSERTFYAVCLERFGVGPKQLIKFRQLNDIHQALKQAAPGEKVSQIASRYGVWEWGRFAVTYKALFGENPSATLQAS